MYMLYRYLFLPKHCSESKWERLCLYGTKNYKEMSTEKRRRLHGMLQEGWEGLKIKHRHLSIVLKQATHWLCLMLLLAINLITRCFLGVFFRLTWSCQSYTYWGRFEFQNSAMQGHCLRDTLKLYRQTSYQNFFLSKNLVTYLIRRVSISNISQRVTYRIITQYFRNIWQNDSAG